MYTMTTKPLNNASTTTNTMNFRSTIRNIVPSILINAVVPLVILQVLTPHFPNGSIWPLAIAGLFPALGTVVGIIRTRHVDFLGTIVLGGIVVSIAVAFVSGDQKLLLVRESAVTGAFGVACLVSLLFPRPIMFYFGRYFATGNNPEKVAWYNSLWQYPYFRYVNRVINIVWALAYLLEFAVRVVMIYTLPVAAMLAVSPVIIGVITVATIAWTMAYSRHAGRRGAEMQKRAALQQ